MNMKLRKFCYIVRENSQRKISDFSGFRRFWKNAWGLSKDALNHNYCFHSFKENLLRLLQGQQGKLL